MASLFLCGISAYSSGPGSISLQMGSAMAYAFLIVAVFLIGIILMITRKLTTLLALPAMAILAGVITSIYYRMPYGSSDPTDRWTICGYLLKGVIQDGAVRLKDPMLAVIFGAILSQVAIRTGIAERIVKTAAELAGEHRYLLAGFLSAAMALAFTSMSGLGAVILVANLTLPLMLVNGLSPLFSACIVLFSLSLGGLFNPANWALYLETLRLDRGVVVKFATVYAGILALALAIFMIIEFLHEKKKAAWSVESPEPVQRVPLPALLTPLVPILLVALPWTRWPIIPAMLAGILYGVIVARPRSAISVLTAAIIEGTKEVAPVLVLLVGIGMLVNVFELEQTRGVILPLVSHLVPGTPLRYLVTFGLLAPLALYRGPLNLWGMGMGIASLFVASGAISPVALMAGFMATGLLQGICDPTNTQNVWLAQFARLELLDLTRKTIIYVWVAVFAALSYSIFLGGVL